MADNEIKVMLNSVQLSFDVPPQIINDRTMVPMRKIFEALGATVLWHDDTKEVVATKDDTVFDIYCGIGSISLFLAQKATKVYGIEIVEDEFDKTEDKTIKRDMYV